MDEKMKEQLGELEEWVSDLTARLRALVERTESATGRLEKELEQQFRALADARRALRDEARKQLRSIRDEQRGLLGRIRTAAKAPARQTRPRKSPTAKNAARKTAPRNVAPQRRPAKPTTSRKSPAKR